mmetsp:Transcript_6884/g.22582  ORF Transcript_6884/g.22582 Transcript_6884/m.22582 type:complete len:244 (-) Transcript_6884:3-734(-)
MHADQRRRHRVARQRGRLDAGACRGAHAAHDLRRRHEPQPQPHPYLCWPPPRPAGGVARQACPVPILGLVGGGRAGGGRVPAGEHPATKPVLATGAPCRGVGHRARLPPRGGCGVGAATASQSQDWHHLPDLRLRQRRGGVALRSRVGPGLPDPQRRRGATGARSRDCLLRQSARRRERHAQPVAGRARRRPPQPQWAGLHATALLDGQARGDPRAGAVAGVGKDHDGAPLHVRRHLCAVNAL